LILLFVYVFIVIKKLLLLVTTSIIAMELPTLFIQIVILLESAISIDLAALGVLVVLIIGAVLLQLLQLIRIRSPNELTIHIKYLALGVHQELTVVSLYLYSSHYHIVFQVYAHLFIVAISILSVALRIDRRLRPFILGLRHRIQHLALRLLLLLLVLIEILLVLILHIRIIIFEITRVVIVVIDVHIIGGRLIVVRILNGLVRHQASLLPCFDRHSVMGSTGSSSCISLILHTFRSFERRKLFATAR
jgi:hypothetical protein